MENLFSEEIKKLLAGERVFFGVRQFTTYFELLVLRNLKKVIFSKFTGTLQELAVDAFNENFENKRILSDQERFFLVSKAMEIAGSELPFDAGYVEIVDKRLRDISQHNLSEEEIEEKLPLLDRKIQKKLKTTLEIIKNYRGFLGEVNGTDIPNLFLEASKLEYNFPFVSVVFPAFLFPAEVEFLKSAGKVKILRFKDSDEFFSELSSSNRESFPDSWEIEEVEPNPLSKALSLFGNTEVKTETEVNIKPFSSRSEDAKYIVDTVVTLIEEGFQPHEIAIAGRTIDEILPLLYQLFRDRGIPLRFQTKGIPLTASPFVKNSLHKLLELDGGAGTLLEWTEWMLERYSTENFNEPAVFNQIEKFYREMLSLRLRGLFPERRLAPKKAAKELSKLFIKRYYLIEENEPFGIHVGTPESIISLLPKAVIIDDVSENVYPRTFPFDPDFSYEEREKINKILGRSSLSQQPFPLRERLISYEFLTFYNLLSLPLKKLYLTYNRFRGKSLFVDQIQNRVKVSDSYREIVSHVAFNCYQVFKRKKRPQSREERGIYVWKNRSSSALYNFYIKKEVAKQIVKNLTITDIVNYLDCPVKALFSLAFKDDEITLDILEGIVYHESIERMLKTGFDENIFDEIFEEKTSRIEEPIVPLLKPYFRENVRRFIEFFREHEIYSREARQEVDISLKVSDVVLRGRVDFISQVNGKTHIVDFKKGNVSESRKKFYAPPSPHSLQVVLYGMALKGDDLISILKEEEFEDLVFHFISVSRAKKDVPPEKWKVSFTGEESRKKLKAAGILAALSIIAMKNGYFIPHRFNITDDWRVEFREDSCYDDYQLSPELLSKFENRFTEILRHILRQWKN
jgi:hypothetical protein